VKYCDQLGQKNDMQSFPLGLHLPSGTSATPMRILRQNVPHQADKLPVTRNRANISTYAASPTTTEATSSSNNYSNSDTINLDPNQTSREGSYESPLVQLQASKVDTEQPSIASILPAADVSAVADVGIVGCGPAGLALAAELGKRGLKVVLVGHDSPFVNNYGVWRDEFADLGLEKCLDFVWKDAICYFREGKEVRVGRAYGRVCRRRLREELLQRCVAAGVTFLPGEVDQVNPPAASAMAENPWAPTELIVKGQVQPIRCKLATLASGAAAGRLLKYENDAPGVAAQTAYGIEAEIEGYTDAYDPNSMLFMDFRRHHSGLYPGTAQKQKFGKHPNGSEGLWGTEKETPSFLYAMPLGGNRVFLEETCLVAKPALPFAVLKRRLLRRCEALGIKIKEIHEEEWSYIPTGGALPEPDQPVTAFGAAANLVHPATGYSIARSLREAPTMAAAVAVALEEQASSKSAAKFVWDALWTQEKRRQASFHVFGMELLCKLDLNNTADFFTTFFALPNSFWRGFLSSQLSSVDLLGFAAATFVLAPLGIKARLVGHLLTDPAGQYLARVYLGNNIHKDENSNGVAGSSSGFASE
jgi:lycopene epsilon-cyclase